MLILNASQIVAFDAVIGARYAEQLAHHARSFSPRLCEVAGADAVLQLANLARVRAQAIGWHDQLLVQFYLELMITFGADFASDPQYAWLGLPQRPSVLEDMHTQASKVHDELVRYQAAVVGLEQCHARHALSRLVQDGDADWRAAGSGSADALQDSLWRLYPEKAAYCDPAALVALTVRARAEAAAAGLPAGSGGWLLGALMLAFGAGVCSDPLYPWVAEVLADRHIVDPHARAKRLWQRVGTYAEHAARYLGAVS